jgi:hypothetical protein
MKALLLVITLVVACTGARAQEPGTSHFTIREQKVRFVIVEAERLLITSNCLKESGKFDCQAYHALKRASFVTHPVSLVGGIDPGAAMCKAVGGEVVTGLDRRRNQAGFCSFSDGSIVGHDTIHYYASTNDSK